MISDLDVFEIIIQAMKYVLRRISLKSMRPLLYEEKSRTRQSWFLFGVYHVGRAGLNTVLLLIFNSIKSLVICLNKK